MLRIATIALTALALAGAAAAQVHVSGYTRSDGTYVAPHTRSSPNSSAYDNYGSYRAPPPPRNTYRAPAYTAPAPATACEGYGCYGEPSATTGRARTERVEGYTRRDGTYVAPYYRSPSR